MSAPWAAPNANSATIEVSLPFLDVGYLTAGQARALIEALTLAVKQLEERQELKVRLEEEL